MAQSVLNRGGSGTQAPPAESLPAPKNFFAKTSFTQRLPPLSDRTIFGQVFVRGGMIKFSKWKVPPTGGQARRNKLLVSWGLLVIAAPLAGSLLAPLRLDHASSEPERLRHLQDTHTFRKLLSHLPLGRAVDLRSALALVEASIRLVGASATASSCAQMPDGDATGPDRFNLRRQVPRPH